MILFFMWCDEWWCRMLLFNGPFNSKQLTTQHIAPAYLFLSRSFILVWSTLCMSEFKYFSECMIMHSSQINTNAHILIRILPSNSPFIAACLLFIVCIIMRRFLKGWTAHCFYTANIKLPWLEMYDIEYLLHLFMLFWIVVVWVSLCVRKLIFRLHYFSKFYVGRLYRIWWFNSVLSHLWYIKWVHNGVLRAYGFKEVFWALYGV